MKAIKVLLCGFCLILVAGYVLGLLHLPPPHTNYQFGMWGGAIIGLTLFGALGLAALKSATRDDDEPTRTWPWIIAFVLVGGYLTFLVSVEFAKRGYTARFNFNFSNAPLTVEAAQKEAVRRYPQLGVSGSTMNREFIARVARYRIERPAYFQNVRWPLLLADECQGSVRP